MLHDDERRTVGHRTDVENADDMIALDLDRGASFAIETSHQVGIRETLRSQNLDCDSFAEFEVPSREDEGHHPAAQRPDHFVLSGDDVALAIRHRHRFEFGLGAPMGCRVGSDPSHRYTPNSDSNLVPWGWTNGSSSPSLG